MRLFGLAALLLVACGGASSTGSITTMTGPNGQYGWLEVHCPGSKKECHELASRACPKGYEVLDSRGNQDRYTSPDTMSEMIGSPASSGQMVVACK